MTAPVLQAMLLADQIYQDKGTGKYVICGIFSAVHYIANPAGTGPSGASASIGGGRIPSPPPMESPKVGGNGSHEGEGASNPPSQPPTQFQVPISNLIRAGSPYAYISLTELRGTQKFELRYVDLGQSNVLFATNFDVVCNDPLETVQITFPLPPLPIPHEGVYALELLCGNEIIGSHRVVAKSQHRPQ